MSIRQRLYPNPELETMLARHYCDARFVYNLGPQQRNLWREERVPKVNTVTQMRELAEARKAFDWLALGSSSVQQAALRDLDRAFQNWWRNPQHFSRPTWGKAGWVRFRLSRSQPEIEASTSARITLDRSGRWQASFTQPQPTLLRETTGAVVGLDMAVAATVTTSDGVHLRMPKLLSSGEAQRKRRLQRKLSRQTKGSRRRNRTKLAIAKLSARETDRRRDWIEKTTTMVVQDYDLIVIEDLKVKNMVRSAKATVENPGSNVAQKRGLNRSIGAQAWSLFRKHLEDKAATASSPVEVIPVNPKHTSQTCPQGHITAQNRKSQAVFACITCGYTANADINAARNILAAGLGPLWGVAGRGGTPHAKPQKAKRSGPKKRQPPLRPAA